MGDLGDDEPEITVIDITPASDQDGTPLRPIFCLKKKVNMKELEEKEDCFILDFNPDDDESPHDISNLNVSVDHDADSPDISVVAEKGQVACRDYPHSRHICLRYPFQTTPHDKHCFLCYCYVCDVAAPCKFWTGQSGHCHAFDNEAWKDLRMLMKKIGDSIS